MKTFFISIVLALAGGLNAMASESISAANAAPITPELIQRLVAEARTNHPALRAAEARVAAAEWNTAAVRSWADPTFKFGGATASSRGSNLREDGDLIYGLEQKLPLFGKPQLARRVAQAEAAMQRAETGFRAQQLRREIVAQLMKLALAGRQLEISRQDFATLETMTATMEDKYRNGQATQVELLQAQNEKSKRAARVATEENLIPVERAALNRLLVRPSASPWPAFVLPPVAAPLSATPELIRQGLALAPRLQVMRQSVQQAEAAAQLTRRQRVPDLTAGLEGRQYSGDGGFREGTFTLALNLPWGNGGNYRKDLLRDEARLDAARFDAADFELSLRDEINRLSAQIAAARREALLYRDEIIPRSEQAMASAQANWLANRGMFRDVLDARRMWLEGQSMHARAVAEQHTMMAELILHCGLESLEKSSAQPSAASPDKK